MSDVIEIPLTELPPGRLRQVQLNGEPLCIANTGEGIYAVSDTCTHARVPLSDGYLEGRQVVCPWHGAMFDLATGRPTCGPAVDALRRYEVRIEGERVIVGRAVPAGSAGAGNAGGRT
jgi:nitrite reductase/ring-hydroxylating ferredoxin subunit